MGSIGKAKWCFLGFVIGIFVMAGVVLSMPNKVTSVANWIASSTSTLRIKEPAKSEPAEGYVKVEMDLIGVRVSPRSLQPLLVLKEKQAERYLLMEVGLAEANAINVRLEGIKTPRPLTHDLTSSIVNALGAKVASVIINDLQESTFYAKIILSDNDKQMEVDSRPSDAVAIAIRVKAPIYVAESVLDKAGVPLDHGARSTIIRYRGQGLQALSLLAYLARL